MRYIRLTLRWRTTTCYRIFVPLPPNDRAQRPAALGGACPWQWTGGATGPRQRLVQAAVPRLRLDSTRGALPTGIHQRGGAPNLATAASPRLRPTAAGRGAAPARGRTPRFARHQALAGAPAGELGRSATPIVPDGSSEPIIIARGRARIRKRPAERSPWTRTAGRTAISPHAAWPADYRTGGRCQSATTTKPQAFG